MKIVFKCNKCGKRLEMAPKWQWNLLPESFKSITIDAILNMKDNSYCKKCLEDVKIDE